MACCVRASQPSCLFFYSRSVRGERLVRKNGGENGGEVGKIHQCNKGEGEGERNATNLATKLDCRYRLLGFSPPDYVRLLPSDQALLSAMYHRLTKSSRSPCQQQQQQEQLLEEQQRQPLQQQHKHLRLGGSPWRPDTPVAARSARLAVLELLNAAAWSVGVPDSWLPSQPIRASGRVTEKPYLLLSSDSKRSESDSSQRRQRFVCLAPSGSSALMLAGATRAESRLVRDTLESAGALADEEEFTNAKASLVVVGFQLNRRFWSTGGSGGGGGLASARTCCCCCCFCCVCCSCGGNSAGGGGGQGTAGHWLLLALLTRLTRSECGFRLLCASDVASRLVSRSDTVPEDWPTLWLAAPAVESADEARKDFV
ncbi:hypothetical protein BOX15_Mlig028875g1 [Macrostomum lignano]|uniref:Uncharacterized protein n=1 Tax=Macrostomum lignano TaxID=282301 RepID=A0A267GCJ0_9PLAT|nr:hypothetical protein BOX15_Mlig028875g1 [Macrostomum lignano]